MTDTDPELLNSLRKLGEASWKRGVVGVGIGVGRLEGGFYTALGFIWNRGAPPTQSPVVLGGQCPMGMGLFLCLYASDEGL